MGLDGVELAIAIEEEFGVAIPDAIGENMRTAGDVYNWVLAQVENTPPSVCLSQALFYKLRNALVANYSLDRKNVHPESRLIDLLPKARFSRGVALSVPIYGFENPTRNLLLQNPTALPGNLQLLECWKALRLDE